MKIERTRWAILRNNRSEILCGLSQQYHFVQVDKIGNASIKTYHTKASAKNAMSYWGTGFICGTEVVKVNESVEIL